MFCNFEQYKTEFEIELCSNDEHIITKMYKPVKYETEEKLKECVLIKPIYFVCSI